jgi:RNA polymerase sigma-70 factor (ECF subfamily)
MTSVEGQAAGEVSKQLGLSTGAIYVAKSRVLARLKAEVEAIERQEEDGGAA